MKKVKYPNLNDYDLSAYEELKGDILYRINGGTEIENSNDAVANAKVGDTLTRSNGEVVVITEEHIQWARDHGGKVLEGMDDGTPNSGDDGGSCVEPEVYGFESPQVAKDTRVTKDRDVKGVSSSPLINGILKKLRKAAHERLGAGKPFDSIEDAAKAWAMTYADDSIMLNSELCSIIYSFKDENGITKYSYNIPLEGQIKKSDPNPILKEGQTEVSVIHSHGSYLALYDDDKPSEADKMLAGERIEFVVTPLGNLYSYDKGGIKETLKTDLPRDPFADDYRTASYHVFRENCYHPDPYLDHWSKSLVNISVEDDVK